MEAANLYSNVGLERGSQQIRLVEILPGLESQIIQCKFHCISLADCPDYVALSYAWGPTKSYKRILLDDTELPVRRNLWWFLHYARIRGSETQLFWIDALCIDQSNKAERSHQVGLMGKIYGMATSVVVWLGEADKEAESDLAMDFVDKHGLAPLRIKAGRAQSLWSSSQGRALLRLCERVYWKRVWIVQEIMHAKDLTVSCGNKSFPWQKIDQIFQKLRRVDERGHIVHHQNAAAILDSPASVIIKAKSDWRGERVPLLPLLETYRDLQSTEVRDKVIGLLGLASSVELTVGEAAISLVDYSITLVEFFWRVLTWIWEDSCLSDLFEMSRAAESLKDILKVYISENELSKKINTSDLLASNNEWIPYYSSSTSKDNFRSSANPNEDWTKISDLAERRRIQNRIAQRNYRKKLQKRLEDLEKRAGPSSECPPPGAMRSQYTPPIENDLFGAFERDGSQTPPLFEYHMCPDLEEIVYQPYPQSQPYRHAITTAEYGDYLAPVPVTLPSMMHFNEAIKREDDLTPTTTSLYTTQTGGSGTEAQFEAPLIGEEHNIPNLTNNIDFADWANLNHIVNMKYFHYRPVFGHPSGWRALVFSYFETLLQLRDKKSFGHELTRIESLRASILASDPIPWAIEEWVSITMTFVLELSQASEFPFGYSEQILLYHLNDSTISDAVTRVYHFLISPTISIDEELATSQLNQCVDNLLKPIGASLHIEDLDTVPPTTYLIKSADVEEGWSPTISLLHQEGQYGILYKEQQSSSTTRSILAVKQKHGGSGVSEVKPITSG